MSLTDDYPRLKEKLYNFYKTLLCHYNRHVGILIFLT